MRSRQLDTPGRLPIFIPRNILHFTRRLAPSPNRAVAGRSVLQVKSCISPREPAESRPVIVISLAGFASPFLVLFSFTATGFSWATDYFCLGHRRCLFSLHGPFFLIRSGMLYSIDGWDCHHIEVTAVVGYGIDGTVSGQMGSGLDKARHSLPAGVSELGSGVFFLFLQ